MTTASATDPDQASTDRAVLRLLAGELDAQIAVIVGPAGTVTWSAEADTSSRAVVDAISAATARWAASAGRGRSDLAEIDKWSVLIIAIEYGESRGAGAIAFGRPGHPSWTSQRRSSAELAAAVYGLTSLSAVNRLTEEAPLLERELRGAVDDDALRLHYQGEIDLDTGALVAVEALVRWQHPTLGLLPPEEFIDLAEQSSLIERLSEWVLEQACAQIAEWRGQYPDLPLAVRVNVSPGQLVADGFVDAVAGVVARHGLGSGQLCLEITERVVPPDTASLATALRRLRARGIASAIDDFGTGYSSLTHLKHLPVDVVKIDRSFISGLGTDAGDTAIVEAVAKLATTFGLELVAEGVETVDEAAWLVRIGCHRAQGHLFGAPLPAAELTDLLAAGGVAHQLPFAG